MDDYVSRDAAIKALEKLNPSKLTMEIFKTIKEVPAADVEPVRHVAIQQTTIDGYFGAWGKCPECEYEYNCGYAEFCGGCGARLIWRTNSGN